MSDWIVQITETAITSIKIEADTEEEAVDLVLSGLGVVVNQTSSYPELEDVFQLEDE